MDSRGSTKALTLPTGVTIDASLPARFTLFDKYAVLVNSPSRPLTIDANLNVRVLTPDPPTTKPTVTGQSGGSLSGTYKVKYTNRILDAFGNLYAESDFSPQSGSVAITSQWLRAADLQLSSDAITDRKLYRTTTGTSTFFPWITLDGNTQTSIQDDVSDAGLSTFSAASLGTPPDLALCVEFKSRLFGVGKNSLDTLNWSEVSAMYAWPSLNNQPMPRPGSDEKGITGFLRRRDALGIGRQNGIFQLIGTSTDNFRIISLTDDAGIESADSVAVYKNVAFFVWKDGIYKWDEAGVDCLTDGKVRRWFTRDDTFNISRLQNSFGVIDPFRKKYKLFLSSAGSQVEDCWIEYDFLTGKVWGPHTSHAFNPSAAFRVALLGGVSVPVIGGRDGYVRVDRKRRTDDAGTGIDFDVVTSRIDDDSPDTETYYGELTVMTDADRSPDPGTLTVQTVVGEQDELRTPTDVTEADEADLSQNRNRLSRIGIGKACKIRFRNKVAGQDVVLRNFEIDPVYPVGKR